MPPSDLVQGWSTTERGLPICNALWIGSALGPLEAACLTSFVEAGHRVDLHVFDEPSGVPSSVRLVDAAETVSREHLIRHRRTGSFSLFSNRFRYALMLGGKGLWIDCDLLCLRPIADAPYIFGREEGRVINGAVLKLPSDEIVLTDLMKPFTEPRWIPPWATRWQRLRYRLSYLARPGFDLSHMSWGTAGPKALTHHLRRHGLDRFALRPQVFYPIGPHETRLLVREPAEALRARIGSETLCIHLWNKELAGSGPAVPGSLVARIVDGSWRGTLGIAAPASDRTGLPTG
jgi:hypothetical protein